MKTSDELEIIIKEYPKKQANNTSFIELQKLYLEMKAAGLLKEPEYNLPPVDTIGIRVYNKKRNF
ncbi:hypothetical protein MCHI_001613 [Candidatus Magnetoovum chiemensis]|nr:hypothetical protein MCHI_001613 [Candidatus Magnetoovum chiemensis]